MKPLLEFLTGQFSTAFEVCNADRKFGLVGISQRSDLGQFQCNGALPAAKLLKSNPSILAKSVISNLSDNTIFSKITIDGPGFMNISVTDAFLSEWTDTIQKDPRFGCPATENPIRVIIDFGGPNIAKPLHVGHLRPHIIGDCLQRLFRFKGESVTSDVHLGDWGTQMGMLICMVRAAYPNLPYFNSEHHSSYPTESPVTVEDLEVMYPAAVSLCKQDAEAMSRAQLATVELQKGNPGYIALWKHFVAISIDALKKVYDTLGISFNLWLGESDAANRIPALVERLKSQGIAQLSEGAWVIPVGKSSTGEEMPPLLLVKRDGGFLYPTTDLATIEQRIDGLKAQQIVYVVDKRQSLHFRQVFTAARLAGIADKTALVHVGFGTMNGPDGKPFKTRDGGTLKLTELIKLVLEKAATKINESGIAKDMPEDKQKEVINMVGLAALKYADLMNYRESDYVFDVDKFVSFEGNTGPYLLYACVRIKSILRKANDAGLKTGKILPAIGDTERQLTLLLAQLPDTMQLAYDNYAPHYLCDFFYKLATAFNSFYRDNHILGQKDITQQSSWLSLVTLCLSEMELIAEILGLSIPEKM